MHGPDVPIAWWIFWLGLGIALFCALIWTLYYVAVKNDESTWKRHLERDPRPGSCRRRRG
jgi:hypothetical protein